MGVIDEPRMWGERKRERERQRERDREREKERERGGGGRERERGGREGERERERDKAQNINKLNYLVIRGRLIISTYTCRVVNIYQPVTNSYREQVQKKDNLKFISSTISRLRTRSVASSVLL